MGNGFHMVHVGATSEADTTATVPDHQGRPPIHAPWRLGTRLKKPDPRVRFLSNRRGNVIGVPLETDIGGGSTALDLRAGDEDRTRDVQLDGMKALQHFLCHP